MVNACFDGETQNWKAFLPPGLMYDPQQYMAKGKMLGGSLV